jgi:hypothetical protein
MYHAAAGDGAGEFVEIMNISTAPIDLTGVYFADGIEFAFPLGFVLPAGDRALLVADAVAFAAAHPAIPPAGTFAGSLANSGERLALAVTGGAEFLAFEFSDKLPWPESPDGEGPSLVLIAPGTAPDHSLATNWRPSVLPGGNPGAGDSVPLSGGDLIGYALASPPRLRLDASGDAQLQLHRNLAADDAVISFETSDDLRAWSEAGVELLGESYPGDGTIDLIYGLEVPPAGGRWFYRVVVAER